MTHLNNHFEMKLKTKLFKLEAGKLIAVLHTDDANQLGLKALDRIKLIIRKKEVIALLDISNSMVKSGEIGLFEDFLNVLKIKEKQEIKVKAAPRPESSKYIKKKLNNQSLSEQEIMQIVKDINENILSEIELSSFISAVYINGFSFEEIVAMTKSLLKVGKQLKLKKKLIVDKHSIGGINGRASMIIVPIIAAAGLIIPKTSSKAITSPAGTADAMSVLANIEFNLKEMKRIIKKTNGIIAWGGSLDLAPVDDKIIKIEHPLSLDPEGQVIASVMSKKASVGAKYLVLDLPLGRETKVSTEEKAKEMALKFIEVGKKLGIKVKAIITDGSQPSGRAFGPALEAKYVLEILEKKFFDNLAEKACILAGELLEMTGKSKKGKGYEKARYLIESGKALKKFKEIIKTQNGKILKSKDIELAKYSTVIRTKKPGKVSHLNIRLLRDLSKIAGAPADKKAGILMNLVKGQRVKKGDKILTIYAENKRKLVLAENFAKKQPIYELEKIAIQSFE